MKLSESKKLSLIFYDTVYMDVLIITTRIQLLF